MASITRARGTGGRTPRKPWTVRYRDELGKSRERSFKTKTEAESYLGKLHDGTAVDPRAGRESFNDAALRWIDVHTGTEDTRNLYRSVLKNHLKDFSSRSLRDVANDRDAAERLLISHPRALAIRPLLAGTCDKAVNDGKLAGHRLNGIRLPRTGAAHRDFIYASHGQLTAIAAGLGDLGLSVWVMRGCGLRISEALALESSDFRSGYAMLRVSRQVKSAIRTAPLKARAAGEYRDVPVPAWLATLVRKHVMTHGTGRLFTSRRGNYVSYRAYIAAFHKHAEAAGLSAVYSPHQLRHAYATALLSQRVPITDVSKWLGHRSIEVTYSTYCHLLPDAAESARAALEAEWEGFKAA